MVDRERRNVRLDDGLVEASVALAPAEFVLHARNPERNVTLGGTHLVFGAVGGPAFVTDLDRGRRPGNFADFCDYVRVIGALDIVQQEGGGPLEPTDLPVATRHLDMYHALATLLDKTWQCLGFGADPRSMTRSRSPASTRGVDRAGLLAAPSVMTDHQLEFPAAARWADVRRAHRDGAPRPAGRGDAVHARRAR